MPKEFSTANKQIAQYVLTDFVQIDDTELQILRLLTDFTMVTVTQKSDTRYRTYFKYSQI